MADIILKEIENGVSITTPNGHEYVYTVYPWRVDKINPADLGKTTLNNHRYNDITFNKECGTLRRNSTNVAMLNIAKLLADINSFMYDNKIDEEHRKKIILAMELAYKNHIPSFGLENELAFEDTILLENLKSVSTKNISRAITKQKKYKDLTQFLQQACLLSIEDKLPPTLFKQIALTNKDIAILSNLRQFDILIKYKNEIEYMLTTQDKKVQDIQNSINNIINNIPNYIKDWLYTNPERAFAIDATFSKTCKQVSIVDIVDKLSIVEKICTKMAISNTDYIKNKSYSEFLISIKKLNKIYQDYKEKRKFELFKERQQKLPKYNKIIDDHKIELVIPYTYQDCQKIGQDFHNCFSGYEWDSYLSTGTRYGCALYKDNKPYICLDIDVDTNVIRQYLYIWNTYVDRKDEIAKIVKNELQNLFLNIK